jgi:hypothetical protein
MSFQSIRSYGVLSSLACIALVACGGRTLAPPEGEVSEEPSAGGQTRRSVDAAMVPPVVPETNQPSAPAPATPEPPFSPESSMSPTVPTQGPTTGTTAPSPCPDPNYPPPNWSPAAEWVPYSPIVASDPLYAGALLRGVRAAIVGTWHGIATTPWTTPYEVDLTFTAGGEYSGRCSYFRECCRAFYYGTDDQTPLAQWRIQDATPGGEVFGELDVAFDYRNADGTTDYGLPAWQGKLSDVRRDASGDRLRFDFATSTGYGPISYDLQRVN